ncbi:energy transducer TonB [Stakelama marina]|uniref:TonB family protein n=1 Tax=Stakelama marina TaxID=2826939 RepID=A0A8T4IE56_9SPHN|nr:TonB family protein [Stakelama marina]MBR0552134.1 TonB family protein [Stakelama marina]
MAGSTTGFIASDRRTRMRSAAGAAVLVGLLGYGLIVGMNVDIRRVANDSLAVFNVLPDPPPPVDKSVPPPEPDTKPEGAAAPPNIKSKPTEVVAPKPKIELPKPPPVPAAPIKGTQSDAMAGAADKPGPGTGAGGQGAGLGGGGSGDGTGGGAVRPPRRISGRISAADFPPEAVRSGRGGTVSVVYEVGVDGRAHDCRIARSSGNVYLDNATCRLIEKRFRFQPKLDASGRPVPSLMGEDHSWIFN